MSDFLRPPQDETDVAPTTIRNSGLDKLVTLVGSSGPEKLDSIKQKIRDLQGGKDVAQLSKLLVEKLDSGEISLEDYKTLRQLVIGEVSMRGSTARLLFTAAEGKSSVLSMLSEAAPKQPLIEAQKALDRVAAIAAEMVQNGDTSPARLQATIDAYKNAAKLAGITDQQEIRRRLIEKIESSGLKINIATSRAESPPSIRESQISTQSQNNDVNLTHNGDESANSQVKSMKPEEKFNKRDGKWSDITGEVVALRPNEPEFIALLRDNLTQPETNLVFRMMSREEFDKVQTTGLIGGQQIPGQVDSGVTWWGDALADSLNQRGGAIYTDGSGASWGGDKGILIAVPRSKIEDAALEKRLRDPSKGAEAGYDAYKTKIAIPVSEISDVFIIEPGRGDNMGVYQAAKLT